MEKYIRVYKEDCMYTFEKNQEKELVLYVDNTKDALKSFTKNMGRDIEEISVYVEDSRSIYMLFRQGEDLKCSILQDENINTGILYSYYSGNYKICNAHMFIEGGNINIIAILKNNSSKVKNVLIHYIYEEESVKKNVLHSLNKTLRYKHCVMDNNFQEIGLYYVDKMFSKNYIFYRGYKSQLWSDEVKLLNVRGEIESLDVKKKHGFTIVAMVEHVASIWSVRIVILDKELKFTKQKIHHSIHKIEKIDIIEQEEVYAVWRENKSMLTTTPLCGVNNINILKFENMNFTVCESYVVEKFCIKCKKESLRRGVSGIMENLDIKTLIENKVNDSEGNVRNLEEKPEEECPEEIRKAIEGNVENLKNSIINKQNMVLDKIKSYDIEKDAIENYLSELNIIKSQKDRLEEELMESNRVIESYEQTIKNNDDVIQGKNKIIQDAEAKVKEKEIIIEELEDELQEELEKGFFRRLFRL